MATVYIKSVEASSWARTEWDSSGSTTYNVGDRIRMSETHSEKYTYACIVSNNSVILPENDPTNWVRVGDSKEYPYHAPGGALDSATNTSGEVYLESLNSRYKTTNSYTGSVWNHATSDLTGNELGTLIFLDGEYKTNLPPNFEKINISAENQGQCTIYINSTTGQTSVFNDNTEGITKKVSGINFIVGGQKPLFDGGQKFSFIGCKFTDRGSIYGDFTAVGNRLASGNFISFIDCLIDLPNSLSALGGYSMLAGDSGEPAIWKNTTISTIFGNGNNYRAWFYGASNDRLLIKKCIFNVVASGYTAGNDFTLCDSGFLAEDSIVHNETSGGNIPAVGDDSVKLINPLFVDSPNGDFRLRPSSPVVGGGGSSKFPADAVWMQTGSGTGTGTESDPYYFSQFTDALIAAVSTNSKQVVCKDGAYRFTTAGEHFRDANLGSVTFIAENHHKAVLSAQRGVNPGPDKSSLTLKLKDFKLTIGSSEHFIHAQFVSVPSYITFDNCYINFLTFMSLPSGSSLIAKSCIIEKGTGIAAVSYFYSGLGAIGSFSNCLFVDRHSYTTHGWNHNVNAGDQTYKNCIFRTENTTNTSPPGTGTFTQCIAYNYNTSNYSDTEVLDADPLMVNYDISSHEDSNYQLRPSSPGIGGAKSSSSFPNSYIWVTNTAGTGGTGTEEDPYYFGSLDQAYTDAGSFGSVVFKNGVYDIGQQTFTFNSDTQANNVNYYAETTGGVEFIAQKIIFGHGGLNVTQSLNYTGLKIASTSAGYDNFLIDQSASNSIAAHIFSSCELQTNHSFLESSGTSTDVGKVIFKNTRLSKVSATNYTYLLEQRNGNTNPINLSFENCIIENFLSTSSGPTKIFRRTNVTLKGTIIIDYSNNATGLVPHLETGLVAPSLITSNCITREDGLDFYPHESNLAIDPLFVDPAGGNFSLRPNSPLIGKG